MMADEIERKFLVEQRDWQSHADVVATTDIDQGYLCVEKDRSIRVRIRNGAATLTIKGPTTGISRQEFEYEVSMEEARALLELCGDLRVSKRRYDVRYAGRDWEIDVFSGRNAGLVVAEIELQDADENFEKPPWIGREVSDDPRYYNSNLAQEPYCVWARSPR
jgi:adenylate cyclase